MIVAKRLRTSLSGQCRELAADLGTNFFFVKFYKETVPQYENSRAESIKGPELLVGKKA
jgi:hypothetical protein